MFEFNEDWFHAQHSLERHVVWLLLNNTQLTPEQFTFASVIETSPTSPFTIILQVSV
jgi:hypothetical protein